MFVYYIFGAINPFDATIPLVILRERAIVLFYKRQIDLYVQEIRRKCQYAIVMFIDFGGNR